MSKNITHPIRYVARHTGLKPYLIRTWELRYRAVCPKRSSSNRRQYSDEDIQRLKLLKLAVDCGHGISSVVSLSNQELLALVERDRHDGPRPHISGLASSTISPETVPETIERTVASALAHISRLDSHALESILGEAAVDLTRQAFLQQVIVPLFERIGELWRAGELKIVHEHMASLTVRSMLLDMLRTTDVAETAPRIVVATPVGHWHEFGALASALAASESGWQALYFGPNLPSEEIAYAVKQCDARALSLSLNHCLDDKHLPIELTRLRRSMGRQMPIFIGGLGVDNVRKAAREIDAVVLGSLAALRNHLERIMRGADEE
jgi:DNA-binding transcriptional MerR regulator/methylmalonyl-CoA mutase cobalamin-binding subunit